MPATNYISSLIEKWKKDEVDEETLNKAGVPRYDQWLSASAYIPDKPGEPRLWERIKSGIEESLPPLNFGKAIARNLPDYTKPVEKTERQQAVEKLASEQGYDLSKLKDYEFITQREAADERTRELVGETLALPDVAFADIATKPFRKGTYKEFQEENPLASAGIEMAGPMGWIAPETKGVKAANLVDDTAKLINKKGLRYINEIFENLRKTIPEEEAGKIIQDAIQKFKVKNPLKYAKERLTTEGAQAQNPIVEELSQLMPEWKAKKSVYDAGEQIGRAGKFKPSESKIPEEIKATVDKITDAITGAARLSRKEQEALYSAERSKRVAKGMGALQSEGDIGEIMAKAKGASKGEMPKADFKPLEIVKEELDSLRVHAKNYFRDYYKTIRTDNALLKLVDGVIPQENELQLLEEVFGEKLIKAITSKYSVGKKISDTVMEVLNLPRAVVASLDLSGTLRQGGPLFWGRPKTGLKAFQGSLKGAFNKSNAISIEQQIRNNPYYMMSQSPGAVSKKLYIAPLSETAKVTAREESFMSRFTRYIPGLAQSERAYIIVLNKLRMDSFASIMNNVEKSGGQITPKLIETISDYINVATGRGDLGKLNSMVPALNIALFSPRFQASRVQLLWQAIKMPTNLRTPEGRILIREFTRDIGAFIAANMTLLGLAKMGGATVEEDPRSTDFGKIKIGNSRVDPWSGLQQWVRFFAQLITDERKYTSTGGVGDIDRAKLLYNFFRYKQNPAFSLLWDTLVEEGKTVFGEDIEATPESMKQLAQTRLTPFVIQDFLDAAAEYGIVGGAILGGLATLGFGVYTYPDSLATLETQIGQVDINDEDGDIYTTSRFLGDMHRYGEGGEYGSDLVKFGRECDKDFDTYYDVPADKRYDYRRNNPEVDAKLVFWGKVQTFQSPQAERLVKQWMRKYDIDESAIPIYNKETKETTQPSSMMEQVRQTRTSTPESSGSLMDQVRQQRK